MVAIRVPNHLSCFRLGALKWRRVLAWASAVCSAVIARYGSLCKLRTEIEIDGLTTIIISWTLEMGSMQIRSVGAESESLSAIASDCVTA